MTFIVMLSKSVDYVQPRIGSTVWRAGILHRSTGALPEFDSNVRFRTDGPGTG